MVKESETEKFLMIPDAGNSRKKLQGSQNICDKTCSVLTERTKVNTETVLFFIGEHPALTKNIMPSVSLLHPFVFVYF